MVRLRDRPGQHAARNRRRSPRPVTLRGAGATNGGRRSSAACGPTRPRTDAMAVTSMAWASSSSGSRPGSRSASIVLPAAGRPDEVEVMPARGRDLEGAPGLVLPDDLGEVRRRVPPRPVREAAPAPATGMSPRCSAAYRLTSSSRVSTGWTCTPGTSRASAALATGTTTWRTPFRAAARTSGRTPGTGRTVPSSPSSPMWTTSRTTSGRDRLARDECRDADGEVEAGADLRDRRRREVDDDAAQGNRVTGVGCGRLDPVGGLRAGAVGAAADAEQRQPGGDVDLDVDEEADDPPQPHRSRTAEGHETAPTTCSIRQGPRRGRRTPTTSTRMPATPVSAAPVARRSASQAAESRRSRASLRWSTASMGWPKVVLRRVLTSTDDQAAAVSGDDVDLAEVAAPVAVEDVEAPVGEVAHRHPLAVAAEPTRGVPRHPRGDGPRCVHAPTVPAGMHPTHHPACRLWTVGRNAQSMWTSGRPPAMTGGR